MAQEIAIHRTLCHKNVVQFHSFFEDSDNVYILLELCRRRVSMGDMFALIYFLNTACGKGIL